MGWVMKVLWVFDWDESLKCLPVLFKTSQGHVLVRFGDETIDPSFYPAVGGCVIRHTMFSERCPRNSSALWPIALYHIMELWGVLQATDRSNLVFKKIYDRYCSKCLKGWQVPISDVGLPSPQVRLVKPKLRNLLELVVAYCEDQAIYDKLGKYGDFYYKIKEILRTEDSKLNPVARGR